MKLQMFKLATLIALLMGGFSCTNDSEEYRFQWDGSLQQEEFRPVNPGTKSASFAIDNNIISFAVPYLVGTIVSEYLPTPGSYWGGPNAVSPHRWVIWLIMAKGVDVTKLAPIITLAPDATITRIYYRIIDGDVSNQVDYTGIAEVGTQNFRIRVEYEVIAPDGSTVTYTFRANAIGDVLP